ncbi:rhomboid family intramembrane serine protease [Tessaracoccus antarcticus]|uniref:Rhomboid family intramembrane serine protease n=1 Tax=Tessaracoccus antarcticus TaxID=2479848 RepID=A0A3M0GB28_9ACTN|nr:rhomboid family intramembrane serine protease [Tessaracoccus antarcticus]RMB62225.1 rhomboid family intramembrane serine protease [Tessaracoccus antarcticus]
MTTSKHWSQLERHDTLGDVSAHFSSRPREDYWFSIGRLQVTSTLVAVLVGAVGMLAWVFTGGLSQALTAFIPEAIFSGQVWRIFTWPVAEFLNLWQVLMLVMLWYFGRDIESTIGRNQMAKLFFGIWVSLTASALIIGVLLPGVALAGLREAQFAILLLWIAEYPTRKFFFGIPAWVLGSVLLGIQILQMIGGRQWGELFVLLFGLLGVAIAARRVGLLSNASFIPGGGHTRKGTAHGSGRKASQHARSHTPTRHERRHTSDEDRMDDLLGKISAEGIHSLTKGERAELEKLRQRRRR